MQVGEHGFRLRTNALDDGRFCRRGLAHLRSAGAFSAGTNHRWMRMQIALGIQAIATVHMVKQAIHAAIVIGCIGTPKVGMRGETVHVGSQLVRGTIAASGHGGRQRLAAIGWASPIGTRAGVSVALGEGRSGEYRQDEERMHRASHSNSLKNSLP